MKMVIVRFLRIIFVMSMAINSANADYTQNQVRYLSYFDVITHLKSIKSYNSDCFEQSKANSIVFGYSSPLSGSPVSSNPNFDFLSTLISCIKNAEYKYELKDLLTEKTAEELGYLGEPVGDKKVEVINHAIEELIVRLIGPEIVLVSYGHIESQNALRNLLHRSSLEMSKIGEKVSTEIFLTNVFILIHLRDEFLSY